MSKPTLDYARKRVVLPRPLIDTIVLRCVVLLPASASLGLLLWGLFILLPEFDALGPWPAIASNLAGLSALSFFVTMLIRTVRSHKREVTDFFSQEARDYIETREMTEVTPASITPASDPDTQSTPSHPPSAR